MDAALPRINRLNTGSLPGLQRLFQLGGRGKRSGNRPETAGGTEVIPVESDGRAVRIFKALGRLKSHAEGIGADHLVGEIAQVFIALYGLPNPRVRQMRLAQGHPFHGKFTLGALHRQK